MERDGLQPRCSQLRPQGRNGVKRPRARRREATMVLHVLGCHPPRRAHPLDHRRHGRRGCWRHAPQIETPERHIKSTEQMGILLVNMV